MQKEIHPIVKELENGIVEQLTKYSESEHTTGAGKVIRFIVKWLPKRLLINLLAEKMKK